MAISRQRIQLITDTILASSSDVTTSLEYVDCSLLQEDDTCWVREAPGYRYYYKPNDPGPASPPDIVSAYRGDGFWVAQYTWYQTMQDEGVDVTQRRKLDFIGATVSLIDDPANDRTIVQIIGAGPGGGYATIQEEGIPLPVQVVLNFIGDGLTATDDAPNNRTNVTISNATNLAGGTVPAVGAAGTVLQSTGAVSNWVTVLSLSGSIDHNALLNLTVGDVHTQYILVAGTRAFTGNQSMGDHDLTSVKYIDFNPKNPSSVPLVEGRVFYDSTDHCLAFRTDIVGATMQIGQESWIRVINKTGSTLLNGTVVYQNGALGNRITVAPAIATSPATSSLLGVVTADILDDDEGWITTYGQVRELDTLAYAPNSDLYLSATVAGAFTNVKPTNKTHPVAFIGKVVVQDNANGVIQVDIKPTDYLADLWDVEDGTPTNGNLLVGNGSYWTTSAPFFPWLTAIGGGDLESGPFVNNAYREVTPEGDPFWTKEIWWASAAKLIKLLETTVTRDTIGNPTTIQYQVYNTSGVLQKTITDTIVYSSGIEYTRTRTVV